MLVCVSAMSSRNECAACVSRDVTPLVVAACSEADGTVSVVCVQPVSEGANSIYYVCSLLHILHHYIMSCMTQPSYTRKVVTPEIIFSQEGDLLTHHYS